MRQIHGNAPASRAQERPASRAQERASGASGASGALCRSFTATGKCTNVKCAYIHGLKCQVCSQWQLDPYDSQQAEAHLLECTAKQARSQARASSRKVECCICLEAVMEKAKPADRQFGLMACNHVFCLTCIREWRSNTESGMDVAGAVRTCPLCRTRTHFVTPSTVWPQSAVEKEEIIQAYKSRLRLTDCKYWNMGRGTCDFGTSCFYRHAYPDGSLQGRGRSGARPACAGQQR